MPQGVILLRALGGWLAGCSLSCGSGPHVRFVGFWVTPLVVVVVARAPSPELVVYHRVTPLVVTVVAWHPSASWWFTEPLLWREMRKDNQYHLNPREATIYPWEESPKKKKNKTSRSWTKRHSSVCSFEINRRKQG